MFPHLHLLENNSNLIRDISEQPTAKNHNKNDKHPGPVRLGRDISVADCDHGHDRPVVADQVLGLPGGERVVVREFEGGLPGGLRGLG